MRLAGPEVDGTALRARREGSGGWVPVADPFTGAGPSCPTLPAGAPLLPCEPRTVAGIAHNGHGGSLPPVQAWLTSPPTIVASATPVTPRRDAGRQVAETQIAVVIAKQAWQVAPEDAWSHVWGITAVNDLSSPDRAAIDVRNVEGRGGVGYTPPGPEIETEPGDGPIPLRLEIDGRIAPESSPAQLPSSIAECLASITRRVPLGAGDIIMTGPPHGRRDRTRPRRRRGRRGHPAHDADPLTTSRRRAPRPPHRTRRAPR